MSEVQTVQPPVVDKSMRYRDRSWLSIADTKCNNTTGSVLVGEHPAEWTVVETEQAKFLFDGMIYIGQKVLLSGDLTVGLITKLFIDPNRHLTHLAVRTARLFGQHKMVPIALVSAVSDLRVQLSISLEQFNDLSEYQSDPTIAEAVDRALWQDIVLRSTDYYQIDVQVRDGVVILHGHVITGMNQWRAETAGNSIPGILGFRSYLIPDDKFNPGISRGTRSDGTRYRQHVFFQSGEWRGGSDG